MNAHIVLFVVLSVLSCTAVYAVNTPIHARPKALSESGSGGKAERPDSPDEAEAEGED